MASNSYTVEAVLKADTSNFTSNLDRASSSLRRLPATQKTNLAR